MGVIAPTSPTSAYANKIIGVCCSSSCCSWWSWYWYNTTTVSCPHRVL